MTFRSHQATRWTLAAITGVAFFIRVINLSTQSLWRDEIDTIRYSQWSMRTLLEGLLLSGHNGPLYYVLIRPWQDVAGISEFALRYPSAVLGVLAIPLGFALARQLGFARRTGLLLALLLATSPYLVWYSQEARMYTLLLAVMLLAFMAYLKALSGAGGQWWVLFVAAATLSFYVHILSPIMLLVFGLAALLRTAQWRRRWRGWLVSMALLTLPYLPLALWQFRLFWEGFSSGHPFYPLRDEIYILLQLYSSGLVRFAGLEASLLFVFLLLAGLFLARPGRGEASKSASHAGLVRRLTLAVWLFIPPLAIYLISLRVRVFEDRYLIYITPAFYLLIALGLVQLRRYAPFLAAAGLGLVLIINGMGLWHQQHRPLKADFRAAAAYLAVRAGPRSAIMVQIPYLQHTWTYYYPRQDYPMLEGLWTNDGKSEAAVDAEMEALAAGLDELWLVVSEETLWDSRRLTRAWLDEHAVLVEAASFARVDLYHYRFRPGDISGPAGVTTP